MSLCENFNPYKINQARIFFLKVTTNSNQKLNLGRDIPQCLCMDYVHIIVKKKYFFELICKIM